MQARANYPKQGCYRDGESCLGHNSELLLRSNWQNCVFRLTLNLDNRAMKVFDRHWRIRQTRKTVVATLFESTIAKQSSLLMRMQWWMGGVCISTKLWSASYKDYNRRPRIHSLLLKTLLFFNQSLTAIETDKIHLQRQAQRIRPSPLRWLIKIEKYLL